MRNRYVLLADFAVFALAVCAAFGFRFDWYFFQARPEFQPYVIAAPIVKVVVFYLFGMYGRFWRYATVDDLVALLLASSVASVAMAIYVSAGIFLFGFISEFSRSVLVADWVLSVCGVAAVRLSIRVINDSRTQAESIGRSWQTGPGRRRRRRGRDRRPGNAAESRAGHVTGRVPGR